MKEFYTTHPIIFGLIILHMLIGIVLFSYPHCKMDFDKEDLTTLSGILIASGKLVGYVLIASLLGTLLIFGELFPYRSEK